MPTKRQNIMQAVGDRLALITIANGYATDLGNNLFYWHDLPLEYAKDALVYRDVGQDYAEINLAHEHYLHVELDGILFADSAGLAATNALGDFIRAIGVDATWGRLVIKTQLVHDDIIVETDGRRAARVLLQFDLIYRTGLYQPN